MKSATIIQARMGSTRLPGKVMMNLQGKTVLQRVIERCQASEVKNVIVAMPAGKAQTPIWELCRSLDIMTFVGSEDNVLERTYEAAKAYNIDVIVDITSDCPLVDPRIITNFHRLLNKYCFDYISNVIRRNLPAGFDTQVYTFKAFEELYEMSKTDNRVITEHSGWNFTQVDDFEKHSWKHEREYQYPNWRLTLDTQKDFELISWLYSVMKDEILSYQKIIDFILTHSLDFIGYNSMAEKACVNSIC